MMTTNQEQKPGKARVVIDSTIDEHKKHPALVRKDVAASQLLKKVGLPPALTR